MTIEEESIYKKLPIMIMVNLYYYNYIDNRIINAIKNSCYIIKKDDNKIAVPSSEVIEVIKSKFKKEYDEAIAYSQDRIAHGINTVYQLYHLLTFYTEIKVVVINISMDQSYSKLIDSEGSKFIALDYKVEKAIIRYDYFLTTKAIKLLNECLRDIKIIKTIRPHSTYSMSVMDLINKIDLLDLKKKEKYKSIIDFNSKAFPEKLRIDDPFLILITDFC